MNKSIFISRIAFFLAIASVLCGCMDKDVYQGNKNKPLLPDEVFDFDLTKQVDLDIDYGFTNDYYVFFEIYGENPMKEEQDAWAKDETLSPVFAASTDKKGRYAGSIIIPSGLNELWLYSEFPGAVSPVELKIADGKYRFSLKEYIASRQAQTRATTGRGYSYPDSWKLLPGADWDEKGLPGNVEAGLNMPPANILLSIKETYNKIDKKRICDIHKDWLVNNNTSEIKITKPTEISLVFVTSGAAWKNTVGYFTYPTGTVPTVSSVQKILAFPNVTPISKENGSLLCGHEVKLKYWNEATGQFESQFPEGVTLGWCLEGMGFDQGNIKEKGYSRYSYSSMNGDDIQRVVALRDGDTNQIVAIGFEDNTDQDYGDALFYVKIAEANAIEPVGPELPPVTPPANLEYTVRGTLAFEDQWPSKGDYDLNDVMMEYRSTLYKSALNNNIYKVVDEFTPLHNGGTYICGFGYQLTKLDPSKVHSIRIDGPAGWEVETGQAHPTVTLFSDIKTVLKKKFTVTTELADVSDKDNSVLPPYNPFIFVNGRSREVHPVNYPPTGKADMELFDTQHDLSNVSAGVYYIARYEDEEVSLIPFGIHLPNVTSLPIPAEGVKIYDTYPRFINWVKSEGKKDADWYKK